MAIRIPEFIGPDNVKWAEAIARALVEIDRRLTVIEAAILRQEGR